MTVLWCFPGKAKRRHVNAEECSELSTEAVSPLTQPHAFNPGRGNRDPHRGLYPTKRRKRGNVL